MVSGHMLDVLHIAVAAAGGSSAPEARYLPAASSADLARNVGGRVRLSGRVSQLPWQHLISTALSGARICYFDYGNEQTVLYSGQKIPEDGPIEVYGVVCEVKGQSKRPDSHDRHAEYHIRVDHWKRVGGAASPSEP